jgi:N-formylmaleamate deformylase
MTTVTHTSTRSVPQPAVADLADVPARSRWIRSDGLRLHALDYGGDGIPLVMLPGITSPAITMDFVARRLTDLVRPIVLDMRGRGLSDSGPRYALDDYADDVVAVLDRLAPDRALVLGHSMGARVAAVVAADRRTSLQGSVLVDPPLSGPERGPYPFGLQPLLDQLDEARRGITGEDVARSWPNWPQREQHLRARWLSSCDTEAVSATHRGFETEDFFTWWPRVPAPTVLVYGQDSPVVTADGVTELTAAHPAAHPVGVPGAGHMVFWDAPDAALAAVRAALTDLVPAR